jgi:hypothetical protein
VVASDIASNAITEAKIADNAITEAKIADNAITLAKMAHGTDGEIITYDSSGAPATVGVGTSGQVLTSNGAGSAPSMQSPAAAGADTSLSNLSSTGENKVCQAWVNFNGIGTVAINDSHNVSSITDNGTGSWYINYTNAMSNSSYSIVGNGTDAEAERGRHVFTKSKSTTQGFVSGASPDQNARDINDISVQVFGD